MAADATPAGTVTFLDGGTPLGTVALNGSGQATLVVTTLSVGAHSITASFGGDANLLGVQSTATSESVTQAVQQIVLVPKPVFSKKKQVTSVGLEAEIEPVVPGGGVPTGTVTFEIVKTVKKEEKDNDARHGRRQRRRRDADSQGQERAQYADQARLQRRFRFHVKHGIPAGTDPVRTEKPGTADDPPHHSRPFASLSGAAEWINAALGRPASPAVYSSATQSYHRWTSRKYMPKSSFRGATSGISTP